MNVAPRMIASAYNLLARRVSAVKSIVEYMPPALLYLPADGIQPDTAVIMKHRVNLHMRGQYALDRLMLDMLRKRYERMAASE